MNNSFLDKDYWNNRYHTGETAWDLGTISTPLKEYADQCSNKNSSVLIPGCGNAYEAEYLLKHGFNNVTLVDIAPAAVEAVSVKLKDFVGKQLHIVCGDFFELQDKFDLIIEQTFFCALEPALRKAYATKMFDLLNREGKLIGILFNRNFEGGPPFGGSKIEYEQLFRISFEIIKMEDCRNSIPPRAGSELFFMLRKKC